MPDPSLLVGPVVGEVTDTTARVLLEADRAGELTVAATAGDGHTVRAAVELPAKEPRAATLTGLRPATVYELRVEGAADPRPGRVRTFSPDQDSLHLAAVSCNFTPKRGDTDLWSALADRYVLPGAVDLVVHMGDQIYGDTAFQRGLDVLRRPRWTRQRRDREILEGYRRLYRQAWGLWEPTARVLAHASNLMIWDDHEIRDDWGSRPEDRDPESAEHHVGTLARRVYREYQRQLWDADALEEPDGGLEHHMHAWGRMGALFVDQRGGRSFETDPARPYLSTRQWNEIRAALDDGILSGVSVLVVVTSVPLAYLGLQVTHAGSPLKDDLEDHWAHPRHRMEQIEFLRTLRRWKEAGRGARDLIVVAGDVHVGGHTRILHRGRPVFSQLVSSPITNRPPRWFAYLLIRGLLELDEDLGWSYRFEHHDYTGRRNFGLVIAHAENEDPARSGPYLVSGLVTS